MSLSKSNCCNATKKSSLDIYVIAGQSNAAGYTEVDTIEKESLLYSLWNKAKTGCPEVLYIGSAEQSINDNQDFLPNQFSSWTQLTMGMGNSAHAIGPEVGMAKVFADYYNQISTTNCIKRAGIVKFAHGGTNLTNTLRWENQSNGNWVSPSYASYLGIDNETYNNGKVGNLYRRLIEEVQNAINLAKTENHFDQINIKGIFWMQGESDADLWQQYEVAFKFFANDLRNDLSKMSGQDLTKLPIIVGEISRTSGGFRSEQSDNFIKLQQNLPNLVNDILVVNTSKYDVAIEQPDGSFINVQDGWHWGIDEIFNIGVDVANCVINQILNKG